MRRTRRLCSTVIDTMGRELMVRGQWQVNDQVGASPGLWSSEFLMFVNCCAADKISHPLFDFPRAFLCLGKFTVLVQAMELIKS
jgi:hypothetical protein